MKPKPQLAAELEAALDLLGATALSIKKERDALLELIQRVYQEIDNVYDVDQPAGEGAREYPFSGAGALLQDLRKALRKGGIEV